MYNKTVKELFDRVVGQLMPYPNSQGVYLSPTCACVVLFQSDGHPDYGYLDHYEAVGGCDEDYDLHEILRVYKNLINATGWKEGTEYANELKERLDVYEQV